MTLDQILDFIRSDSDLVANITHWQKIPAKEAATSITGCFISLDIISFCHTHIIA